MPSDPAPPTRPGAGPLDRLVRLVRASPPRLGGVRLACIDGPAGSGKTTTSAALLARLEGLGLAPAVLRMDDLYEGWGGLSPDVDRGLERRVLDQVLLPLAAGAISRWQRYDWHAGAFDGWVPLPPPDVLILEGCGSGASAYAAYISALVWVEAGLESRIARGRERDGVQVLPHWLRWMETEERHFELNRTRARADIVVRTD